MSVQVTTDNQGTNIVIRLPKEFDFHSHKEFRDSYRNARADRCFVLDFSQTSHIDSSALGMLLLMREDVSNSNGKIQLKNCSPKIKSLLEMANFHKLFQIS